MNILLQTVQTVDWMQLLSFEKITISGILLGVVYYFWKRTGTLETKIDDYIKQKDEDAKKYYDLVLDTTKVINENNRIMQRIEKLLDKKLE